MKIGFLSDAHGNPEGLARCLALLRGARVEEIYFLGDAVGYLSAWDRVLQALDDNGALCIAGNHDRRVLDGGLDQDDATAYQLLPGYLSRIGGHLAWMETWPQHRRIRRGDLEILMVHGSPASPLTGYVYPWSDKSGLAACEADVIVMGHTHRPFVEAVGGKILANVGSAGLPRDVGNLASCGILDTDARSFRVFRVPFDIDVLLAQVAPPHADVLKCLRRRQDACFGELVTEPVQHFRKP